jgi:hypothetical protein
MPSKPAKRQPKAKPAKLTPGPKPDMLPIDGNRGDAVKNPFQKKKPASGWPK